MGHSESVLQVPHVKIQLGFHHGLFQPSWRVVWLPLRLILFLNPAMCSHSAHRGEENSSAELEKNWDFKDLSFFSLAQAAIPFCPEVERA